MYKEHAMQTIPAQEWKSLPEHAQRELLDFFLFLKQKYANEESQETHAFTRHSAELVEDWHDSEEDKIWT
jgi:hypothetical protein